MEQLSMCRVCLAEDLRMHVLSNTHLQDVYESLNKMPLEPGDSRPVQACYICYARLRNCYELKRTCLRSEELFTEMLSSGNLPAVKRQDFSTSGTLRKTAVINMSMGEALLIKEAQIKVEPPDEFVDVVVKNEEDEGPDAQCIPPVTSTANKLNSEVQAEVEEKKYKKKEHLVKLVKQMMSDDKLFYYQCRACRKSFYQLNRLNSHICANSDKKPYKCDVCEKTFKLKSRLISHIHRHCEEKMHQCNVCEKSFDKKYKLSYHIRSHINEKPYQCEVCQKCFITKSYLWKHVRMHSVERPHECQICKKCFKRKSNLLNHVRLHSSEKPYQCDVCKKCFKHKGNLKKHRQIHSGDRPHGCDVCGKCFINNSDLVKHKRTHTSTGAKPYQCDVCKETFNYNSNYLKHKRVRCKSSNIE